MRSLPPSVLLAKGGALVGLLLCASCSRRADPRVDLGKALFAGDAGLVGRVGAEDDPLPPAAVRCSNCHVGPDGESAEAAPSYGPHLSRQELTATLPRRGGPPTRYDEASFCRLLATGIDPAHIIIVRAMPRYTLSAASCEALWTYLTASAKGVP
jgi:hypothetical protein